MAIENTIIFFFLRQTADIDHISPIIWRIAREASVTIKIVLYHDFSPHQLLYKRIDLSQDFRLQHLRSFSNVETLHFLTLCQRSGVHSSNLLEIAEHTLEKLFTDAVNTHKKMSVAFDWHFDALPLLTLKIAKKFGATTFMLPHAAGCLVERNRVMAEDDLGTATSKENWFCHPAEYEKYLDYDVFPSDLVATDASPSFPKDRVKVLGSARYCEEWIEYLSEICPPVPDAELDKGKLKIAVFPRSWRYPLNWQALANALSLIAELDDVSIIVQHHTRENDFLQNVSDNYRSIVPIPGKLRIVDYNVYSGSLIRWADITLSLCTSVSFEAVVLGKPVLELEYLHALRSHLAETYPQLEILSHDELLSAISAIQNGRREHQLTFDQRSDFIRSMIHCGDSAVLSRYKIALLESPSNLSVTTLP